MQSIICVSEDSMRFIRVAKVQEVTCEADTITIRGLLDLTDAGQVLLFRAENSKQPITFELALNSYDTVPSRFEKQVRASHVERMDVEQQQLGKPRFTAVLKRAPSSSARNSLHDLPVAAAKA